MRNSRVEERISAWNVLAEETLETESSFVVFGRRGNQDVVLKELRHHGDEWRSGEVLEVFAGNGTVRVYEHMDGAVLLEKLNPGTPLTSLALNGKDEEATEIIADVIARMSRSSNPAKPFATVYDWARGFEHYLTSGDTQIPNDLVKQAQQVYINLCSSERDVRLLHGDLQHYNVLFDHDRGWVAIDPKGLMGEVEYEIGASLRNPCEKPELFALPETIERRIKHYEATLKLDADRVLAWGFSQAVLSAIWSVEDGFVVDSNNPALRLANAIRLMLN